jgi:hypothetical protein
MTASNEAQELKDRLNLIESMIAEGRRTTTSWGWTFVFWGLAYYAAIGWTAYNQWPWAWLVTMLVSWLLCMAIIGYKKRKIPEESPQTRIGRGITAIWASLGISLCLLLPALGISGHFNQHIFVAIVASMLGLANGASGILLRWKAQLWSATIWWVASVAACFGSENQCTLFFAVAIFFCQIVFGVYGMVIEARERRLEATHA